jgi:hypothetical protein
MKLAYPEYHYAKFYGPPSRTTLIPSRGFLLVTGGFLCGWVWTLSSSRWKSAARILTERCFQGADNATYGLFRVHASRVNLARAQGRLEQLWE